MIAMYTGTPGSGKTLSAVDRMKRKLEKNGVVISNFEIFARMIKNAGKEPSSYIRLRNDEITPSFLVWFSEMYKKDIMKGKHVPEERILLVLDEAQLIFNARSWMESDRMGWISFFSQHRKLGYEVVMIAQDMKMLDRQIRALVEFEYTYRKARNMGIGGQIVNVLWGGNVHIEVRRYAPTGDKIGSRFFRAEKSVYALYDTYTVF